MFSKLRPFLLGMSEAFGKKTKIRNLEKVYNAD